MNKEDTWRTSFEAVLVIAGLLVSFGVVTLLLAISGDQMSSTASYAFWSIGIGITIAGLLVTRRVLDRHG